MAATLGSPMDSVNTSAQTFAFAIKNPMVYIGASSNWSTQDTSNTYLWNDKNVTAETDGKSIFDPSPIGWRLPIHGVWSDFTVNCTGLVSYEATYTPASAKIPATAQRGHNNGNFSNVGIGAALWTSTPSSTTQAYRVWISNSSANVLNINNRAYGVSLRAVRE